MITQVPFRWSREDGVRLRALLSELRTLLGRAPRRVSRRFVLPTRGAASPVDYARILYQERRDRTAAFEDHGRLFAEPAWDILLELYVAAAEDRRISVSAACAAAGTPATTALRTIASLEARGLVVRSGHPTDRRMRNVAITPEGAARMRNYLSPLG